MSPVPDQNPRIDRIADAIIQLTSGNLDARLEPSETGDEVDAIMVGFNWLAEELAIRENALQQLVKERTADLEKALETVEHQEARLRLTVAELARSNGELEQFAYVASHDLQEPLRMVGSYTSLLKRRYQGKLDAEADEFIDFAMDGVNRMRALINDLLTYSRLGREERPLEVTDARAAVDRAVANLQTAIVERGAVVTIGQLPTVMGNFSQLTQLFQNLVGNGLKFCKQNQPEIHIDAERNGPEWTLSVRDNGIGIDPQYRDRIFLIFQRLHKRDEYEGTGIGLAICRKVVEQHGGRIWVESEPGKGATFRFTLRAMDRLERAA